MKSANEEVILGNNLPDKPYGQKISGITKSGIEVYWKKPEKATGYEVFRAYEIDGDFTKIAEITRRDIGTYIDNDFEKNRRKVFYSVRSFLAQENGERTYSQFTEPCTASFREDIILEREVTVLYSGTSRLMRAFYGWGEVEDAKWSSDNEEIATINEDGLISAKKKGLCQIICRSAAFNKEASSLVNVDRDPTEPLSDIKSRFVYDAALNCWNNPLAQKSNEAILMLAGDLMCGTKQMRKQFNRKTGWNFNDSFTFVREVTSSSDFAIANLETLLAAGWPYQVEESYILNKNNCNAPARYLDAVKFGGFDAVILANNHNCDGGVRALNETIRQVDKYLFGRAGAYLDKEDSKYLLVDINGIKVGFLAYTAAKTGFNGKDSDWTEEEKNIHLSVYEYSKAKEEIENCRKAGAEYIIVYMHWGYKNFTNTVAHQTEQARQVADIGADYIVGGNPHLIQHYEMIKTKDGREVPCAFSLGNFLAFMNQVEGNRDSILLRIHLKKDEKGTVSLIENNYIPFHTYNGYEKCFLTPIALSEKYNCSAIKDDRDKYCLRINKAVGQEISPI